MLLLLVFIGAFAAAAGTAAAIPLPSPSAAPLTPEQVRSAIAGLSDAEVRALLLRRIDEDAARAATAADASDAFELVVTGSQTVRHRLGEIIAAAPDPPYAALFVVERLTGDLDATLITDMLLGLAVILLIGASCEALFRQLLGRLGDRSGIGTATTDLGKLGLLMVRAIVDALALGVFAVTAILTFFVLHPDEDQHRRIFWVAFLTILGARAVALASRVLLAPRRPDLRLPALGDAEARSLYRWLIALAALVSFAGTFGPMLGSLNLPEPLLLLLGTVLQWVVVGALIAAVWLQRRPLDRLLGVPPDAAATRSAGGLLARRWHILFSVGLFAMGLFATVSRLLTAQPQSVRIVQTLLVLGAIPLADGFLRLVVRHLIAPDEPAPATADRHDTPYAPVILRNLRIVLIVAGALALGRIWNIHLDELAAGSLGTRAADALFTIIVALLLASALWGVVKTAVARHVSEEALDPHAAADAEGAAGLSRLQTLLPVVRKFLFATIVAITGMTMISALGVDIGPLLAGAGVVGIAIGFGAQALVRDIVSGIFFLIDDAFRIGEYIDVGAAKGTVERISIRSLRLRHHLGQINTVPFGEIKTVINYSRDWAIMKLELRVPLDTDIEKVRKLVKRVGQEMQQHPELGLNLLQPPKSQGVHRMEPSAYVVRVKYMAKPGEQFILRREVFRRLHDAFRENGIRLGVSPTVVDAGDPASGRAVAAESVVSDIALPGRT
ncbi:MAG: mechanosensitive ion channel [Rhodospirillales bacterium]